MKYSKPPKSGILILVFFLVYILLGTLLALLAPRRNEIRELAPHLLILLIGFILITISKLNKFKKGNLIEFGPVKNSKWSLGIYIFGYIILLIDILYIVIHYLVL